MALAPLSEARGTWNEGNQARFLSRIISELAVVVFLHTSVLMLPQKAALKMPQSRRFATAKRLSNRAERLDCGGFSTAFGCAGNLVGRKSGNVFEPDYSRTFCPCAAGGFWKDDHQ
jgi:hypothetical protein